ncbi:hypothetical protein, partial [Deinococcus pimensis]|uniref:hypothetical protein n=1 Tax=Deinococcus pimensis TaxID=309888 RepID=UPI0005EAE4E5
SLRRGDGRARLTDRGATVYRFEKGGYRYDVRVDGAHAEVTVSRAGRVVQREALRAFETGGPAR